MRVKHLLGFLLLSWATTVSAAEARPQTTSAEANQLCRRLWIGNSSDWVEICDQALAEHPQDGQLWFQRGLAWHAQSDFDRALVAFQQAAEWRPQLELAWDNAAELLIYLKRDAEVPAWLDRAVATLPESVRLRSRRGNLNAQLGNCEQALDDLTFSLAHGGAGNSIQDLENRGFCYLELKAYDAAWDDATELIKSRPEAKAYAYYLRAQIRRKQGRFAEGLKEIDQAIAANANAASFWDARGNLRLDNGETAAAVIDFSQAMALEPSNMLYAHNLAIAQQRLGQYAASRATLNQALERDDSLGRSYYLRGVAWELEGKAAEALADFDRALCLHTSRSEEVLETRAWLLVSQGRFAEARGDFEDLLQRDSDNPLYHEQLAWLVWLERPGPASRQAVEQAVERIEDAGLQYRFLSVNLPMLLPDTREKAQKEAIKARFRQLHQPPRLSELRALCRQILALVD